MMTIKMCECGKLHLITNARLTVEQDPTMQGGNRTRAMRDLGRRLEGVRKAIAARVKSVPVIVTNKASYQYQLDPYRDTRAFIQSIVDGWFDTGAPDKPLRWFFDQYVGASYASGTTSSATRIMALAMSAGYNPAALTGLQAENVLLSPAYFTRVERVYQRAFNDMKGFTDSIVADVARILGDGMSAGQSPASLVSAIAEKINSTRARAMTIARTEINEAYRSARRDEAKSAAAQYALDIRVMHRSALIPTTRPWHAERHGKVFTIDEQDQWWSEGGNRINCLCVAMEVIFNKKGQMFDAGLQAKLEKQRETYFGLAA